MNGTRNPGRWAAAAVGVACLAAGSVALAQVTVGDTWSISYGSAGGRGGGVDTITVTRFGGNSMAWRSTDGSYSYFCRGTGDHCEGSWTGANQRGWFAIDFTNQDSFSGRWGYAGDRSVSGPFTGSRR